MAKPLKIGFIQAINKIDVRWYRPLSFGYLKAYIDKYLNYPIEMQFLDSLDGIEELDIIGISATSQDFSRAKEIAKLSKDKKKEIITILGGHHITYLPETLSEEFDVGLLGEGEKTFLELVHCFYHNGLRLKLDDLRSIKGIVFHENGKIIITKRRELITQLETLPFPFREKGDMPYIFSSRGCPYRCAFCSSSAFWEKTRFFSAEYVVREIEWILERFPEVKHIPIWDDLFIANKPRFRKIVEMIEERKICDRVTFSFSVRANLVDDELNKAFKRINVSSVSFGAESGSNRILKLLNKKNTIEMNQKAIDTLYRYGIQVACSFIVGSPTETEDEVRRTYEFILRNVIDGKLSPNNCIVNILMPMPGTAIWDHAVRSGLIDVKNMDWKRLSVFASYRNSNISDFTEWVELRRRNNSIYLAEETMPQARLFELMYVYENAIKAFEKNREFGKEDVLDFFKRRIWKLTAPFRAVVGRIKLL